MKKAIVIIRPNRYFETKKALTAAGFGAMCVENTLGRGRGAVSCELNDDPAGASASVEMNLVAKKMLIIVLQDEEVDDLVQAVLKVNSTGNKGDGKIFILPVDEVIRIRTRELNEHALT
jgi:nitrogen regulatory protein PII 2